MRDYSHRCYSCDAEAKVLCHGCAAKSCLDHLTAAGGRSYPLLCESCLTRKRQANAVMIGLLLVFVGIVLANAGR